MRVRTDLGSKKKNQTGKGGTRVVVQQDDVRRLAGHVGRVFGAHGDADLCALEGGGVVDAVPRDCNHLPPPLVVLHQLQLLLRRGSGEHHLLLGEDDVPVLLG